MAYTPSTRMVADGLTKALTKKAHDSFVRMLGLEDIQDQLASRQIPSDL